MGQQTVVLGSQPDLVPPSVAITQPHSGAAVVADRPFTVTVQGDDNVGVASYELQVDGVSQGSSTEGTFLLQLPLNETGASRTLVAIATDRAGNASTSEPVYLQVLADAPPVLSLASLGSVLENVTQAELQSGFVRLLQNTPATLVFRFSDDVGVASLSAKFDGQPLTVSGPGLPVASGQGSVTFTPPISADGTPHSLELDAVDSDGHAVSAQLIVAGRSPEAPTLALVLPKNNASIASGSIQLVLQAVAGDDTGVASVDFFLNGQSVAHLPQGISIPTIDGTVDPVTFLPVAQDADVMAAVAALSAPYNDASRLRQFRATVLLPPGFVSSGTIDVRAVATDLEGNPTTLTRSLAVVPDTTKPVASILSPSTNFPGKERTPLRVQVAAFDNVFVEQVQVLAGPSPGALAVVSTQGGFAPQNAVMKSDFNIYAPPISIDVILPGVDELGGGSSQPYLIAARAIDISGNLGDLAILPITVNRDVPPSASILTPVDGSSAVEGTSVPVVIDAEDDVAIYSVALQVNGQPFFPVLYAPPFQFLVPVLTGESALNIVAVATDSAGHSTTTNLVHVGVVEDQPPTIAIAQPLNSQTLTEGRALAVVLAANDDVGITTLGLTVEGGLNGTVHLAGPATSNTFTIPVPYGSAGRTLTIRAQATDTLGHVAQAAAVQVLIAADTTPPTLSFLRPANQSEVVEGQVVQIEAVADDNVQVTQVSMKVNGSLIGIAPAGPYRFNYTVPRGDCRQPPHADGRGGRQLQPAHHRERALDGGAGPPA